MKWLISGFLCSVALGLIWFSAQVIIANRSAASVFNAPYCWLRPGPDVVNLRELSFAGTSVFVPNPARQINRGLLGLGLDDPEVRSPHFAILAFDSDDLARVAGWSYSHLAFFAEDQAVLRQFVSSETIARCRSAVSASAAS